MSYAFDYKCHWLWGPNVCLCMRCCNDGLHLLNALVSGMFPSTLHELITQLLEEPYELGTIIVLILQMRRVND